MFKSPFFAGPARRNGQTFNNPTFTGVAKYADGTAAAPAITFTNESNTGFFRATAQVMGLAINGTAGFQWNAGQFQIRYDTGRIIFGLSQDTIFARGSVAGVFQFASAGSFTANGSVATSVTSLGPTGSHTTIQEWLTIQNASGTTRYIPCY